MCAYCLKSRSDLSAVVAGLFVVCNVTDWWNVRLLASRFSARGDDASTSLFQNKDREKIKTRLGVCISLVAALSTTSSS